MKELDIKAFKERSFDSVSSVKEALLSEGAKTQNLNFIFSLRNIFLEESENIEDTDLFLWDIMYDHNNISLYDTSLFLYSCNIGSSVWFNKLVDTSNKLDADKSGHTAPFHAVLGGNLTIVKSLYEKGFDFTNISTKPKNILLEAASCKNIEIFEWLLDSEFDADLNATLEDFVLNHDNYEITSTLLYKGADYEKCIIKEKPLVSIALYRSRFKTLQALLDAGHDNDLPFDRSDVKETVSALLSKECKGMDDTIRRNYAIHVITQECNSDKSKVNEFIRSSTISGHINDICICAGIQPMFDLEIDSFNDDIQGLIYEAMVI